MGSDLEIKSMNSGSNILLTPTSSVGIGMSPSGYGKLSVNSTGVILALRASSGAGKLGFYEGGAGRFYLQTLDGADGLAFIDGDGSTEHIRINASGQVGIGTNSPAGTIHGHAASPQLRLTSSADSGTPLAQIGYAGGSGYFLRLGDAANNEDVMIRSYGNTVFNGGNVGIGTSSPATKLHLYGSDASIQLQATGATDNAWTYYKNASKTYLVGVRGSSSHAFTVYDLTEDHSRFRVNSDGGVAIGEDNVGYAGQILSIKSGTGNNVLYGESSDANCIMSVRDSGSSTNVGYGCISNAHVFFNDGTEIARFSTGSGDKYSYSSAGLGGSGTNLHLHSDDSEIRMANNIIHSDNSGNTKFTIRTGYGVTSDLAELSLDGGFVSMNVGTSFTEMLKATASRVIIGRTNSYGYYLRVQTSTGIGEQGSHNSSYYHHSTDRGIFYFGTRCEASGGFHTYSDENLKKEITVINGALDSVAKMNGVTFKWKDPKNRGGGDEGKQFGVIAQNMLEVDSELPSLNDDPLSPEETMKTDDSFYTMDYTRLTPYFIEAIKELKAKNEPLEERIKTLEG